jgi:hypothetical protein
MLLALNPLGRAQMSVAAFAPVQQCSENNRAVRVRQTEPIDCAVRSDQRSRAPIANQPVVLNGGIRNDP